MRDILINVYRHTPQHPGGPLTARANVLELSSWIAGGWIPTETVTVTLTRDNVNPEVIQTETLTVSPFEIPMMIAKGWHLHCVNYPKKKKSAGDTAG